MRTCISGMSLCFSSLDALDVRSQPPCRPRNAPKNAPRTASSAVDTLLKTARTKIDVHDGTLTMEFDGEIIKFNIFEAMMYPSDIQSAFSIDVVDMFTQEDFELRDEDELEVVLSQGLRESDTALQLISEVEEIIMALQSLPSIPKRYDVCKIELPLSYSKLLPFVVQAPILDLKPLPDHQKYAYLGSDKTLSVIITKDLTLMQEERLMRVLWDHKTAIG